MELGALRVEVEALDADLEGEVDSIGRGGTGILGSGDTTNGTRTE